MKKQSFSLFKRHLKTGKILYYYSTYNKNGKRKQYSTGKKDYKSALKYCMEKELTGQLSPVDILTLNNYTKTWFVYDKCNYIQSRLTRGGTYSHSYADQQRSWLMKRILPNLGHFYIHKIRPRNIEQFLFEMKNLKLSNTTINHYLSLLKVIFHEAWRLGDIPEDPTLKVKPFINDTREKGIFTDTELSVLFDKKNFFTAWNGNRSMYLLCLTASLSGARLGEVQALTAESISENSILIEKSLERKYGIKGTKTGKSRKIQLPEHLLKSLQDLGGQKFIFEATQGNPVYHKNVYKYLYHALETIGIDNKTRNTRNLTFHSFRHTLASKLRNNGVNDFVIREITGHSEKGNMLDHYSHLTTDAFKNVDAIQNEYLKLSIC